jgi:hypothetical protein
MCSGEFISEKKGTLKIYKYHFKNLPITVNRNKIKNTQHHTTGSLKSGIDV